VSDPAKPPSLRAENIHAAAQQGSVAIGAVQATGNIDLHIGDKVTLEALTLRATPPAPPPHFTGREDDLAKFTQILTSGQNVAITALQGMGGIGKTALAQKLAERVRDQFPGGVLWRTLGPSADVLTALDVWARHADPLANLTEFRRAEDRAEAVRPLLARLGKLCVIIDDVWDAKSARILLVALPPDSVVLITTRNAQLVGALGCHVERIDRLSPAECLELLTKLYAPQTLDAYESEAKDIIQIIDCLPLALKLIRGLADKPARLPRIVEKLRQKPMLDILKLPEDESRETSLEWCLALSYNERLDADMQRRFRALGVFARAPYDRAAMAAVWDESEEDTITDAIEYLIQRNLLEENEAAQEYSQHASLRAYALALLEKEDEHGIVAARHAAYYRRFAREQHWRTVEHFFNQIDHGWQWIRENPQEGIVDYILALQPYINLRGRKTDLISKQTIALHHAEQDKRAHAEANILASIGIAIFYLQASGNAFQESLDYFRRARDIYRILDDSQGTGRILQNIGSVYDVTGKKQEALSYYRQALELFQQSNDEISQCATLNNMGTAYENIGEKQTALDYYNRALELHQRVQYRRGESLVLNNLSRIYFDDNQFEKALQYLWQAFKLNREEGDRWFETTLLSNLAKVLHSMELFDAAANCLEQAVKLDEIIGHPDMEIDRAMLEVVRGKLGKT
jgi:tetratricopeptide (TPR) repeat protein